jgi:hypothetical protein
MASRRRFLQRALTGSALLASRILPPPPGWAAAIRPLPGPRVLVLDGLRGDDQRLLLVDARQGKIVAEAGLGINTSLAVDAAAGVASVIHFRRADGAPGSRVDFYRLSDLQHLGGGLLPAGVPRLGYQEGAAADSRLAPGGRVLLIQGAEGIGPAHMATTVLNCVRREPDREGLLPPFGNVVRVPRSYGVRILRTADWPRVHVYNGTLGL